MTARHALLERILDYAGLFPPAALGLEEALAAYAALRDHPRSWMLGRFVIPAGRLAGLALPAGGAWPLSVLMGRREEAWAPGVEEEVRAARAFAASHPEVTLESTEVSVPAGAPLEDVVDLLPGDVFCEFGWGPELEAGLEELRPLRAAGRPVGLKLRTGGVLPEHHPSAGRLAEALSAAAAAGVPVKFTAGLHRPARAFNESVGADQFGFLNVFAAAILAVAAGLPPVELEPVLEERRLEAFQVGEDLRVAGFRLSADRVAELRRSRVTSFGSCSFLEPVEALEEAGWFRDERGENDDV